MGNRRQHKTVSGQEGIALLLVLWMVILLTVIVGQFCYSMRTEVNITRNFRDRTKGYYLARAGLNRAIQVLIYQHATGSSGSSADESKAEERGWRVNADIPAVSFADGRFKLWINDERGKINLNEADQDLLTMMVNGFDIPDQQRFTIVSSILDWRDNDDFIHSNGAENDYYQSLADPYKCRNGPFRTTNELLLVKGVTKELWDKGLKDMVTVHSDLKKSTRLMQTAMEEEKGRINVNAAPLAVLRTFPGMDEERLQAVIDYRREKDFESKNQFNQVVGSEVYAQVYQFLTVDYSSIYTIRSTGMVNGSRVRPTIEAVVRFDWMKNSYRILDWVDYVDPGVFSSSPAQEAATAS